MLINSGDSVNAWIVLDTSIYLAVLFLQPHRHVSNNDSHTRLLCFSSLWLAVCRGPCGFYLGQVKNSQRNVM